MSETYMYDAGKEAAKKTLADEFRKCVKSLTPAESWFIQALLNDEINHDEYDESNNDDGGNTVDAVDLNKSTGKQVQYLTKAASKLSDEKLFSTSVTLQQPKDQPPLPIIEIPEAQQKLPTGSSKARRPSNLGLWKAYEDGVHPHQLKRLGSKHNNSRHSSAGISFTSGASSDVINNKSASVQRSDDSTNVEILQLNDGDDALNDDDSENRIVPTRVDPNDDGSSWDSQDDADHRKFDAWEVMKDEYAKEFGFDFVSPVPASDTYTVDNIPNSFQIFGTSADDTLAQPHVMSPPMMDALMNFLPESIIGQNYWLRYSLIRDGASIETLQRYVRATECTIMAIETRTGEVFGSFTSHPWHKQYGFFGSTPAFVWKMRHSRRTKCNSLFDQAQLESELDVYMALEGCKNHIQVCHHDAIGVGGDDRSDGAADGDANSHGFAFYLNSDLSRGTTSRSMTFHSPSLCGNDGNQSQVFDVAGLEVWSLTPCFSVAEAEKLEMTKFFIEESIRNLSNPRTPYTSERSISNFSSEEFDPRKFYQRVGHDAESQARRDRWEYMNTMHTVAGQQTSSKDFGSASPRFGYGN